MLIHDASQLPPQGRLMGLDHGSKTIGLAITDASRQLAQPLETIQRGKFKHDLERLGQHMTKHQPSALVVGYPLNMDGTAGPRCQSVRAFVRNLEQHTTLPILMWDERLSSSAAHDLLIDSGIRAARRHEKIDAAAACMILESLLSQL